MHKRTKKAGSAFILTIMVAFVAFTMTTCMLVSSETSGRITAKRVNSELAFRIAEAGLQHAAQTMKESGTYTGETNVPFGAGKFTTIVKSVGGSPSRKTVKCTATVNYGLGLTVSRSITSMVDTGQPPSIGYYSVVAKGPLTFRGNVSVNSYPVAGLGDVGSNAIVDIAGSVAVDGGAHSTGAVSIVGASKVSGSIKAFSSTLDFPTMDYTAWKASATANGVTNGDVTVSGAGTTVISGLIKGNLNLGGTGDIVVKSPVWVTGALTLSGSARISGGTIICEKDMNASGHSGIQQADPSKSLTFVTLSNFSITAGAYVGGAVVVPNGLATLRGHSSIFGTLAANTISCAGTSSLTRNTAFTWPSEFVPLTVCYYQE